TRSTRDWSSDVCSSDLMRSLVFELKTQYDYVLIDCPAGIEQGFKNAIAGADEAVVVATPEVSSIRDADRVVGLLAAADVPARLRSEERRVGKGGSSLWR